MLSLIAKPLSPAQIIILQQIVELQAVLLKLEETLSQTAPGEQKEQIEALIAKVSCLVLILMYEDFDRKCFSIEAFNILQFANCMMVPGGLC